MLKAKSAGILRPLPPLHRLYAALPHRRRSALGASLLVTLLAAAALLLGPAGPAQAQAQDGRELLLPPCDPDPAAAPTAPAGAIAFVVCDDDLTIESVVAGSGLTFYPEFSPDRHNYLVHVADSVAEVKVTGKFQPPWFPKWGSQIWEFPGYAWAFVTGDAVSNPGAPLFTNFGELIADNGGKNANLSHARHVKLSPGVTTIQIGTGQWFKRAGPTQAEVDSPSFTSYFYRSEKLARKTYTLQLVWQSPDTPLEAPDEPEGPAKTRDYDNDDDGLIEVSSLAQLDAIRWDLDGDGYSDYGGPLHEGFRDALAGMGCPASGCVGYELAVDLDFDTNGSGDADEGDDYWNSGHGWMPIGMDSRPFRAVFEGNGRVISNLYISSSPEKQAAASGYGIGSYEVFFQPAHIGLFEEVGARGVVRGVGLEDVDVSRTFTCRFRDYSYCTYEYVGVLAGSNRGKISASWATGVVSHRIINGFRWRYGPLAGAVTAGGLVGYAHSSSVIANSRSGAAVSVHTDPRSDLGTKGGGLVGHNDGSIIATYATGSVHSNQRSSDSIIPDRWYHRTGGLVGHNKGPIKASYSIGRVTGGAGVYGRTGLVGYNKALVRGAANYFDSNTSGQHWSAVGRGKTSAELRRPTGYAGIYASWNVDLDGDGNGDDSWDFGTSRQYPVLKDLGAARQRAQLPEGAPYRPTYSISARASVSEGQSATLTIALSEAAPAGGVEFTVTPGYGGSATASAADVGSITSPVTVAERDTTLEISIPTVDDAVDENDETFTVVIAASATGWWKKGDGKDSATVTVTDDDVSGVTVNAANPVNVTEGETSTYAVALNSQPTADVTVKPTSDDLGAATVSPASYVFTPSAWNAAATFTVSGVSDADTDDESVGIIHRATSQDGKYDGIVIAAVNVAVSDNTQLQQAVPNRAPTVSAAIGDVTIVNETGTRTVSLSGVFDDADGDALTISAASSDDATATVSVATDYSGLTVSAQARGTATITVTADDGNEGAVEDSFTVTVKAAPVVASALADISGLEVGSTQDVSLSGVFSDADGDTLTITAASSDETRATVSVAPDGSRLTVAGVAAGTANITVTAEDSDGNRVSNAFESEQQEGDPADLPGPVVNLQLSATADSVTVSWRAPESGDAPNRYIVHIKPEGGGKGAIKRPKARKTSVTFRDLEAGTTYKVWARAQNDAGKGERTHASITLPETPPE